MPNHNLETRKMHFGGSSLRLLPKSASGNCTTINLVDDSWRLIERERSLVYLSWLKSSTRLPIWRDLPAAHLFLSLNFPIHVKKKRCNLILMDMRNQWWNLWGANQGGTPATAWRSYSGLPHHQIHPLKNWPKSGHGPRVKRKRPGKHRSLQRNEDERSDVNQDILCMEMTKGRKRVYHSKNSGAEIWAEDEEETRQQRIRKILQSYLLPQGYPESVAPQYSSYMFWRGVQYFFGGAMSVFTTKSLLTSLGIAGNRSGEAAAAINWVLKDGAGRLGRFLFARWGRALDAELKQFRLAGDLLMEMGAAMELSTVWMPSWFLPLACTANLSKNLATVAASSTRAPIYRTFALQNNLADVTAKGESVANLADIIGTVVGIMLSKVQVPLVPTFAVMSAGYLYSSWREVDSVELPFLNKSRLSMATRRFLRTGKVPGIAEANHSEPLLPWVRDGPGRIVLGATVAEAFDSSDHFQLASRQFRGMPFIITYRPKTHKVYVLLREGVELNDVAEASFTAHVFLYLLDNAKGLSWAEGPQPTSFKAQYMSLSGLEGSDQERHPKSGLKSNDWEKAMNTTRTVSSTLFMEFNSQANKLGWKLHSTTLNPYDTRLLEA